MNSGIGNTMDNLVVEFLRERTLSIDMELNEPLYNTIYYLEKSDEIVNRLCYENQQDLLLPSQSKNRQRD